MENQKFNDWKFQIYWNKLEWGNPRNCIEQKIYFVCLLKKYALKIIIKMHISLVNQYLNHRTQFMSLITYKIV